MQSDLVFIPSNPAFAELYQQYAPEIFTYLRLHTPTKEDAEDLLVDVFLAALGQAHFQAIPNGPEFICIPGDISRRRGVGRLVAQRQVHCSGDMAVHFVATRKRRH